MAAASGPTCPVSPSVAFAPARTRSYGPVALAAAESVRAVAQVSLPAKALSQRRNASSAPRASASLRAISAWAGPIEMTVTLAPFSARSERASSRAFWSSGLMTVPTLP
jgi:hypothetical protein